MEHAPELFKMVERIASTFGVISCHAPPPTLGKAAGFASGKEQGVGPDSPDCMSNRGILTLLVTSLYCNDGGSFGVLGRVHWGRAKSRPETRK